MLQNALVAGYLESFGFYVWVVEACCSIVDEAVVDYVGVEMSLRSCLLMLWVLVVEKVELVLVEWLYTFF